MLSTALGAFGWRPADFWAATPHEWCAAFEYHERAAERIQMMTDD